MKGWKVILFIIVIIILVWFAMSLFKASQQGFITSQVVNIAPSVIPSSPESMESHTTQSGLTITTLVPGTGAEAKKGDTVSVQYTGTFSDGSVFDSSIPRGQPFTFVLGAGMVIAGWDEGIVGMKVGEKRKLNIPYTLAYGENGYGPIPPKADLTFDVELVSVE